MSAKTHINEHAAKIKVLPFLRDEDLPRPEFKLWENIYSDLSSYYAPFEYLNLNARLILVGITPGHTQMNRALNAARSAISSGASLESAMRQVKREGSFSGKMRPNIVNMLNRLGYQQKLGLKCVSSLWSTHDHLVHFCSLLKFPVFLNGKNYEGKPKAHKNSDLSRVLHEHFVQDMQKLPHDALLVPLGESVLEVVSYLKKQGLIPQDLMQFDNKHVAPPHPSGANAESIALLLEPNYPAEKEYVERKYSDYISRKDWMRKGTKPQSEEKYKAARAARWRSVLILRYAYGLQ